MVNHLAIIMDGNGRWAQARHLPRSAGHKKGASSAEEIIRACPELGINYLTLYTFSSENWNRPEKEVSDLMNLLRFYLSKELKNMHKNGVKIRIIGNKEDLPDDIRKKVYDAEKLTANNTGLNLNIALSYGSRQEIAQATKKIAEDAITGTIRPESITLDLLSNYLYTKDIPEPDLLIRTGGEHRISNFLLWQMAYTEFYFTEVLWPDFTAENLTDALQNFTQRERRFGRTEQQETA